MRHKHKCPDCATIWEHERPPDDTSEEEYHRLHNCPECGRNQRRIYFATRADRDRYNAAEAAEAEELLFEVVTILIAVEESNE